MNTLLAIESSCDETSLAILKKGQLSGLTISSQIALHQPYGGVVPELASRQHLSVIHPLLNQTLKESGVALADLDAIAVTVGPGLSGSLLVGVAVAKMLGALLSIPVYGVNHMEGHLYSVRLEHEVPFPYLCLVCSEDTLRSSCSRAQAATRFSARLVTMRLGRPLTRWPRWSAYPIQGGPLSTNSRVPRGTLWLTNFPGQ